MPSKRMTASLFWTISLVAMPNKATGGSAKAAGELIKKCGGIVVQNIFLIELTSLNGKEKLKGETVSLFQFD